MQTPITTPETTGDTEQKLLKINKVCDYTTIGRSAWYALVKAGRAPKPVKLSARLLAWRKNDIDAFISTLTA